MRYLTPLLLLLTFEAVAADAVAPGGWASDPPRLESLVTFAQGESDLRVAVVRYAADRAAILRRYEVQYSPVRAERLRAFYDGWQKSLRAIDFDELNHEGQIDYLDLRNRIDFDLAALASDIERGTQIAPLLPFADRIRLLQEERHDRKRIDPRAAGNAMDEIADLAKDSGKALEASVKTAQEAKSVLARKPAPASKAAPAPAPVSRVVAARAAAQVTHLLDVLTDWTSFYNGYDPEVSWWIREPFARADTALKEYSTLLKEKLAGFEPGEPEPIIGDPVLAAGLRAHLANEMIAYTPEELIAIGEREFAWIEAQFRVVARRMGFGEDWKAALEHTKNLAPPPGEKPWAIFDIAKYSEEFIAQQGSITLPALSREVWRLAMQTPERQLINPFFTGGEVTRVSYPTDGMKHADKLMSMRGNTPHFNFATVHHELVPGHHMQRFMTERFNSHRSELNDTPFWREGWALYWELQLWDANFPRNDPDRIGMLFWRLHRAGRIVFSLNYQLGNWTPQQAVDFLVDRVGHERANAEAEVRRSALAPPLYQAAYLLGGLQFRALYRELVDSKTMSAREFHDTIMQGGTLPVDLVRARLTQQPLSRDYQSRWKFYEVNGR